ncbi:hypothetical protein BH11PSE8_BH11PSE8_30030 [soil metagenome]
MSHNQQTLSIQVPAQRAEPRGAVLAAWFAGGVLRVIRGVEEWADRPMRANGDHARELAMRIGRLDPRWRSELLAAVDRSEALVQR